MRRALAALLATAALAGCGVGAGGAEDGEAVGLTVTRAFGTQQVLAPVTPEVAGGDTVMRLLRRNAEVRTRYGGGFVQAIEGVEGGRRDGRPVDWFFYVNGIEADEGAAAIDVRPGDRVWWDHHDWGTAMRVPAVVGSFPEPFVHGAEGRRFPVRVECPDASAPACSTVLGKLVALGVPAAPGRLGTPGDEALRVLVGTWDQLRGQSDETVLVERGPQASGIYARFERGGRRIVVLDPRGRPARTLGAGSGLVAATAVQDRAPVWFVTGTDEAGLRSAARAFEETALADRFALAVADDLPVSVPAVEAAR